MSRSPRHLTREELMTEVCRLRGDLSQQKVADAIGVSQSAVSQAERNPKPSKDAIRIKIVEHFSDYIVEKEEKFVLIPRSKEEDRP